VDPRPERVAMTLAVVVPTYRRQASVNALLASLFAGVRRPDQVIVVDNDPLASCMPEWPGEWQIEIVRAGMGLNIAAARNRGWRAAQADLCVFVDDDNTVASETLAALEHAACDITIGLVAPVIYEAANPSRIWCAGIRRSSWTTRTTFLHRGASRPPAEALWPTDDMPDAFAVPRQVLMRIGGFDEVRFPFHYEEADLCMRIRLSGLKAVVVGKATAWHNSNVNSSLGLELSRAFELSGRHRVELMVRARVAFHRLYSTSPQRLVSLGAFIPVYTLIAIVTSIRIPKPLHFRVEVIRAIVSGFVKGYREPL